MDKKQISGALILILISVIFLGCVHIMSSEKAIETQTSVGTGRGYSSQIKVQVTLQGNTIVSIDLLESGDTPGLIDAAFDGVVRSVLKKQSTEDIDAVTGATGSSKGVMEAIKNALEDA